MFRLVKRLNTDPKRSISNGTPDRGLQTPRSHGSRASGKDSSNVDSLEAKLRAQMLDGNAALLSLADDSDDYLLQVHAHTPAQGAPMLLYSQQPFTQRDPLALVYTYSKREAQRRQSNLKREPTTIHPLYLSALDAHAPGKTYCHVCQMSDVCLYLSMQPCCFRLAHRKGGTGSGLPHWPCHHKPAHPLCCRLRSPICPRSGWLSGKGPSTAR